MKPHTDTTLGVQFRQHLRSMRDLATRRVSLVGGLRLQSSVIALAFEIAWLRGERRGERRPSSAGERVGAEAHVDMWIVIWPTDNRRKFMKYLAVGNP